jgi:hypothetical protein
MNAVEENRTDRALGAGPSSKERYVEWKRV